ncbi:hypothetical protein ACLOJK_018466 [Asimina triloba]
MALEALEVDCISLGLEAFKVDHVLEGQGLLRWTVCWKAGGLFQQSLATEPCWVLCKHSAFNMFHDRTLLNSNRNLSKRGQESVGHTMA